MEQIQEVIEEEVLVNVCLDVVWQLFHETLVLLRLDGVVLVVLPVVLEVDLKPLGHVLWKRAVLVEMSEETKPFG